ncbi:hypothetical protein OIU76_000418 [Salix suchowensis]|nr:hypothetical protein OIU76_000418 [Salix suchowensis]
MMNSGAFLRVVHKLGFSLHVRAARSSSRKIVMPPELMADSFIYRGLHSKNKEVAGALRLMRSDKSLSSFFVRAEGVGGKAGNGGAEDEELPCSYFR